MLAGTAIKNLEEVTDLMVMAGLFVNLSSQLGNLLILGNDNIVKGFCAFNEVPQFVFSYRKVEGRRKADSRSTRPDRMTPGVKLII